MVDNVRSVGRPRTNPASDDYYSEANVAARRAYMRAYKAEHAAALKVYYREWRAANPDKHRQYNREWAARDRAKKAMLRLEQESINREFQGRPEPPETQPAVGLECAPALVD